MADLGSTLSSRGGTAMQRRKRDAVTFSPATFCCLLLGSTALLFGVGTLAGYLISSAALGLAPHPTTNSHVHSGSSSSQGTHSVDAGSSEQIAEVVEDGSRNLGPAAWELAPPAPEHAPTCTDTCSKAKNGVCEDGSQAPNEGALGPGSDVFCDLGTDCTDCGPWRGAPEATEPGRSGAGPIAHILGEQHLVRVKHVDTLPPILMAYTDPKLDFDVSDVLERTGMLEGGITQIFYEVLRDRCIRPDGSRALVLDVGANFGYFSVYAARLGCRVIAWEPVPLFRAFVHYNLQVNNVSHLVTLRGRVVGPVDGVDVEMMVPKTGIWGTASVAGINQFMAQAPSKIKVEQERLDSVVKQDVLLLKVDVEGYETMVVRSMTRLAKQYLLENIILEYSPGIAERLYPSKDLLEETPKILVNLLQSGYKIMQLNDNYGKAGHVDWNAGVPPLPEVTLGHLQYDLKDVLKFKDGMLGCPKPPEMAGLGSYWNQCNIIPEDLHPKSFHSMFSYNTNIWAAHSKASSRALMKASDVAGFHALDQNSHTSWTSVSRPDNGIAMKVCFYLEPYALVKSRCNCSWAANADPKQYEACQVEEAALQKAMAEGRLPWAE